MTKTGTPSGAPSSGSRSSFLVPVTHAGDSGTTLRIRVLVSDRSENRIGSDA